MSSAYNPQHSATKQVNLRWLIVAQMVLRSYFISILNSKKSSL